MATTVDKLVATEKDEGRHEETSLTPEADTGCEQPCGRCLLEEILEVKKQTNKKNCTEPKEEEELSPFNLDEFVNMDEVLEVHVIIENPPPQPPG